MYLNEQYLMYELADHLVKNNDYEILHIDNNKEELWLERYENKTSKVIRLYHYGFDWKNHLKTDIAHTFQKTKAMEKLLNGKNIEIYNIYVSSYSPIDNWNMLKKPLQLEGKNPLKMKVYYLDEHNFHEEFNRLKTDVGLSEIKQLPNLSKEEKEKSVSFNKQMLANQLHNKKDTVKKIYSFGKPIFTYLFIIINIIVFLLLELSGGSTNIETLINLGAKYNPAILKGEWWRIISSMFLHIGLLHLFMNMVALYYLGTTVERIYGSGRFVFIYLFAGLGGGLASFAFTINVSAGASGAIFGLFGALLFFGLIHKRVFFQTMGRGVLLLIGINIVFGFLVPQIDNGAHLGGLIAGFFASAIVHLPRNKKISLQVIALITYVIMIFSLIIFGVQNNLNDPLYQVIEVENLIKDEDYHSAVEHATKELTNSDSAEAELLFQRSIAYIELNNTSSAIDDLEESIEINNEFPEAHYNLAMLYFNRSDLDKAKETVNRAYELNPDDDEYIEIYEEITGKTTP